MVVKDRVRVSQVRGTGQAKQGKATEQKPPKQGQEAETYARTHLGWRRGCWAEKKPSGCRYRDLPWRGRSGWTHGSFSLQ